MRGKACLKNWNKRCPRITPAYAGKRHVCNAPCKGMGDHPRVCGEKDAEMAVLSQEMGSPPRMRGKAKCQLDNVRCGRITPAYAGKSVVTVVLYEPLGDHPRVCGEKVTTAAPVGGLRGSPPRMRGKGMAKRTSVVHHGITPAYAGKSRDRANLTAAPWDHPRVCGEKAVAIIW